MKIKSKTCDEGAFAPIKLTIMIESKKELRSLWAYLNLSGDDVRDNTNRIMRPIDDLSALWNEIDRLRDDRGVEIYKPLSPLSTV